MKIYISLPISGRPYEKAKQEADNAKAALSRMGHTPVSPFDIYAGKNPTYADHLAADIRAMMDCDAVLMMRGWKYSVGCNIEQHIAYFISCQPSHFGKEKTFRIFYQMSEINDKNATE